MSASRWAVSFVGTAFLAGVLWWAGPLWPPLEPVLPRVAGVQALLLLWAVGNVALDVLRRRRADALGSALSRADEERADVSRSLSRALALLGKRRRAALTALPWYAIIGPPGAGKTTALLNAGLEFPLAAELGRGPVAGAGGTRLCDWWFTDRAVLIDTAGRFTTQDSDAAVDRAGWSAFLALLKRTRPAQPLNGVLVAIGVPDVVAATEAERAAYATAIAARLAELEGAFGTRLPVYAIFTKADLVGGFVEFFDDLDAPAREQVWGETFPLAPQVAEPGRFETALRGLAERTAARMTRRVADETRPDRRRAIAGFPAELAGVVPPLAAFAGAALGRAQLRGLYLASGTQEGTPLDRLAGAMARSFGLPPERTPHAGPGRSYFLSRLLRDVVFGEAMLVSRNPALERRRRWIRAAGFAVVLLLLLGAGGLFFRSAQDAEAELGPVAAALARYETGAKQIPGTVTDGDLSGLIPLLDQASALASQVPSTDTALGFGQAAKLRAGAQATYRDALSYALFPRLLWRLEADMRGSLPEPDRLYEKLRVYLMLGGAGPLDPAAVRAWFEADWRRSNPDDESLLPQALVHLDALLAAPLPTAPLDNGLVEAARASIERVPAAARAYAALKTSAASAALAPWRPVDSLGPAGVGLFVRASGLPLTDGVPGLFTANGLRTVLLPALPASARAIAAESWVTGRAEAPPPAAEIERAVQGLYTTEFTARWDAVLADLAIAPIGSLPQAAQALYIIASPESPMRALLRSIATQLDVPAAADPALAARYAPLVALTYGDGAALDRSLRLVADIQQALAKIAALPLGTALPPGGEDISAGLLTEAARRPPPLDRWLTSLGATAAAFRTGDARRQLSLLFNAPGGPAQLCAAATARYPFAQAGAPIAPDEFAKLFGPAGALDGFLNTRLKPFVDTATNPWSPRPGAPIGAADAVAFQRAAAIRAAFFPNGANSPAFPVEVSPEPASRVGTLSLGTVAIEAGKGAARPALVTWPPPTATASLQAASPGLSAQESGFWALHRLVGRGRVRPAGRTGGEVLTFGSGPDAVAFLIRSPALAHGLLADFRCPAVP